MTTAAPIPGSVAWGVDWEVKQASNDATEVRDMLATLRDLDPILFLKGYVAHGARMDVIHTEARIQRRVLGVLGRIWRDVHTVVLP